MRITMVCKQLLYLGAEGFFSSAAELDVADHAVLVDEEGGGQELHQVSLV